MTADDILAELERRQDACVIAAENEAMAESAHKAMESAVYKAIRSSGQSIKDAEQEVRSNESVLESYKDLVRLQSSHMKARAAVDRAKLASELFRTVRADSRRV